MSTSAQQKITYIAALGTVEQKCRNMRKGCQDRARKRNLFFDIPVGGLIDLWPEDGCCPVLGIELSLTNTVLADDSPSLDRLDPSRGYVMDNLCIMSLRANRIKSNATSEELMAVALWTGEL